MEAKDKRFIYLFNRRPNDKEPVKKKEPKQHEWKMLHCDPLKHYVEYTCRCCGWPMAEYVYDIANTSSIIQLLDKLAPNCD